MGDFKSLACYFHPGIRILHLNQVIEVKMKEGVSTIINEVYFKKNWSALWLAIFELQKLKAKNMNLNHS